MPLARLVIVVASGVVLVVRLRSRAVGVRGDRLTLTLTLTRVVVVVDGQVAALSGVVSGSRDFAEVLVQRQIVAYRVLNVGNIESKIYG